MKNDWSKDREASFAANVSGDANHFYDTIQKTAVYDKEGMRGVGAK